MSSEDSMDDEITQNISKSTFKRDRSDGKLAHDMKLAESGVIGDKVKVIF